MDLWSLATCPARTDRAKPRCMVQYSRTMEICPTHSLTLLPLPALSDRFQHLVEFPMRKLLATVALATLLSSSAHAQYGVWRGYYRAYAQVPPYAAYRSYGFYRSPYPYS